MHVCNILHMEMKICNMVHRQPYRQRVELHMLDLILAKSANKTAFWLHVYLKVPPGVGDLPILWGWLAYPSPPTGGYLPTPITI